MNILKVELDCLEQSKLVKKYGSNKFTVYNNVINDFITVIFTIKDVK